MAQASGQREMPVFEPQVEGGTSSREQPGFSGEVLRGSMSTTMPVELASLGAPLSIPVGVDEGQRYAGPSDIASLRLPSWSEQLDRTGGPLRPNPTIPVDFINLAASLVDDFNTARECNDFTQGPADQMIEPVLEDEVADKRVGNGGGAVELPACSFKNHNQPSTVVDHVRSDPIVEAVRNYVSVRPLEVGVELSANVGDSQASATPISVSIKSKGPLPDTFASSNTRQNSVSPSADSGIESMAVSTSVSPTPVDNGGGTSSKGSTAIICEVAVAPLAGIIKKVAPSEIVPLDQPNLPALLVPSEMPIVTVFPARPLKAIRRQPAIPPARVRPFFPLRDIPYVSPVRAKKRKCEDDFDLLVLDEMSPKRQRTELGVGYGVKRRERDEDDEEWGGDRKRHCGE
ncbi:hypothetical protein BC829DRAFT_133576 [Chytridium lagenaria]|nr:hypothetical protein BC829DRAFT_133576 [Chytridium lagenaria]